MNAIKHFMTTFYFLSIRCHLVLLQSTFFLVSLSSSLYHSLYRYIFIIFLLLCVVFLPDPSQCTNPYPLIQTDFIFFQIHLTRTLMQIYFFNRSFLTICSPFIFHNIFGRCATMLSDRPTIYAICINNFMNAVHCDLQDNIHHIRCIAHNAAYFSSKSSKQMLFVSLISRILK